MHALGTFMVALPTLLTGFTIAASLETAGRLRGGKGLFGWIGRLPWGEPVALGGILALVALLPGGFGGMVNASYAMDTMVHNTAWITAHFHLILGGTVVTAYFAGAYALWPKLTGRRLRSRGAAATQLWLWFVGLLLLTVPWHSQGLLGMPRRVAYMPYDPALVARWQRFNPPIMLGGMLMILSALLFVVTLLRTQTNPEREADATLALSEPLEPVVHVPKLLNGFAAWNWLLLVLMALAWAYPIGQFFSMTVHKALAWGFR
jgi:cytochrome c oxidase subunit 1